MKITHSQNGMSLVETMIAMAITAIIGIGMSIGMNAIQSKNMSTMNALDAKVDGLAYIENIRRNYRNLRGELNILRVGNRLVELDLGRMGTDMIVYQQLCEALPPFLSPPGLPTPNVAFLNTPSFSDCPAPCLATQRPYVRITHPSGTRLRWPSANQALYYGVYMCAERVNHTYMGPAENLGFNVNLLIGYKSKNNNRLAVQWESQAAFLPSSNLLDNAAASVP